MNVAILHYHLNPGGVTRVIANHLLALDAVLPESERLHVLLLFDGKKSGWATGLGEQCPSIDVSFQAIPSLQYQTQPSDVAERMAGDINRSLSAARFSPEETVLHAHNHSLGKNVGYSAALRELAAHGYALLLQPHDFAEDFRPSNYGLLREAFGPEGLSDQVYFQGPRIHYATLNRRDLEILRKSGIDDDRLHFLPNPVPAMPELPARGRAREALQSSFGIVHDTEFVLYPVRGIRRKNVGEFVLLSVLRDRHLAARAGSQASVFGITLAPQNPVAIPYYECWSELVGELDLPCRFGVGDDGELSFPENLAAADRIVTTSVAEGFGMVYLESWLAGRGLVGRNLPEITPDFTDAGLQLDALYDRLDVPVEWIGRDVLVQKVFDATQQVYTSYGIALPSHRDITEAVERMTADGLVDFGSLDEALQELVIRRVAGSADNCDVLLQHNPTLQAWDDFGEETIARNRSVVERQYSLAATGERLRAIYRSLLVGTGATLDDPGNGASILDSFLDVDRFRLIRT